MNKIKELAIVLPVCLALSALVVVLFFLDPSIEPDSSRIALMVIVAVWAFFILPSMLCNAKTARENFGKKSYAQTYGRGAFWGTVFGASGLFILFFVLSPIGGTMWFIHTLKQIILDKNQKKEIKSSQTDKPDN